MRTELKQYLFNKHVLVSETEERVDEAFHTLFSLAHFFSIKVTKGRNLARQEMIEFASGMLGKDVPKPFYLGFPETVRKLTANKLYYDQLLHYAQTYGLGDFSQAGHSQFEEQFERTAFVETTDLKEFAIYKEVEAKYYLFILADNLLAGTRPLSTEQMELVELIINEYDYVPKKIASKNTAIRLLLDMKDLRFAKTLSLSDVIKVVDELNFKKYFEVNGLTRLHFGNQERKWITALINDRIRAGRLDRENCFEKKKYWNGLLHHIHYQPVNEEAASFVKAIRNKGNESAYAAFEKELALNGPVKAAAVLKERKGAAAVLRNLNYLVSRTKSTEEITALLQDIDCSNTMVLLQLYREYALRLRQGAVKIPRSFSILRYEMLKIYTENEEDREKRRSALTGEQLQILSDFITTQLKKNLAGRVGKVWIDPQMKHYALPLQETAVQGGFGVLTKGSRVPIGDCKKLRAFTYWEKVDDIDLSVFALDEEGRKKEYSWRTMAGEQSSAITFSGDETSGFHGGSEYFDIDLERFVEMNPKARYLVFCNNVYSCLPFSRCVCRAGYMEREKEDSGEIFEPKTVKSSFTINANSTFAYLFALDLTKKEMIWLNLAKCSNLAVAGEEQLPLFFLLDCFATTEVLNVYDFFTMAAKQVVSEKEEAEVIVTDQNIEAPEGVTVIREYDIEKMIALMN